MSVAEDAAPASLESLRQAHLDLMRNCRVSDTVQAQQSIRDFLERARLTGRRLDDFAERDAAQAILDYWAPRVAGEPGKDEAAYLDSDLVALEPFDNTRSKRLDRKQRPFVGLDPFTEGMAHRFFGREEARHDLTTLVRDTPLVVVSGPSGSGKSSLVFAGVLPQLTDSAAGERPRRALPPLTPGMDPIAALLQAVRPSQAGEAWLDDARSDLVRHPAHFAELVRMTGGGEASPVVVVDQAEELFTLNADESLRRQFAEALVAAASNPDVRVVVTIREDYAKRLLALAPLKTLNESQLRIYTPPPLTPAQLREAIERLAAAVGLRIEPAVVDNLVKEVLGEPAALPLLQFALLQLWKQVEFNRIGWDEYRKVGAPSKALSRTAEQVFENLGLNENQQVAEAIFLALTKPGVGAETVRRRRPREALWELAAADRIDRVLEPFVEAGLIRRLPGRERGEDRFEIAHEALLRNWPRLLDWAAERRQGQGGLQRLAGAAELWDRAGRGRGYLLGGAALAQAERALAKADGLEDAYDRRKLEEFLGASRRQRRLQATLGTLVIVGLIIAALAALSFYTSEKRALVRKSQTERQDLFLKGQTEQRETVSAADTVNDRASLAEQSLLDLLHKNRIQLQDLPSPMRERLKEIQTASTTPLVGAGYDSTFLGRALPPPIARQSTVVLDYPHFSIAYDPKLRRPLYAASTLDRSSAAQQPPPLQEPRPDPRLPTTEQPPLRLSVPDLGLFPLASWREVVWGADPARAVGATTAAPGLVAQSWAFHQGPWTRVESWLQTSHNPTAQRVAFFTGPVYRPDDPVVDGLAVPQAFWKIAISSDEQAPNGLRIDAFVVDQSAGANSVASLKTTVAAISRLTGLRFPGLDRATGQPAASPGPTVYVQFAVVSRSDINDVAQALRERGYRIPGAERLESATPLREVRYYYDSDAAAARKLAADTAAILQDKGYGVITIKARSMTGFTGKRPALGTLELWLGLSPRPTAQVTPDLAQDAVPTPASPPDRDLAHLKPEAAKAAEALMARAAAEGIPVRLYEGYRSPERQAWLYALGRTRPGPIVTNAKTPTLHATGLAFDLVFADGRFDDNARWRRLGELGKAEGLVWGGDQKFPDVMHFETPDAQAAWRRSQTARSP